METRRSELTVFSFIDDIGHKKNYLLKDDTDGSILKKFSPYITTKHFSYFRDTVFIANEINLCSTLKDKEVYDFFYNIITPRKRYYKRDKNKGMDNIDLIKSYYKYSTRKAEQVKDFFTDEDFEYMKAKTFTGGKG